MNDDDDDRAAHWLVGQAADADMWAGQRSGARLLLAIVDGVPILDPISASDWGQP